MMRKYVAITLFACIGLTGCSGVFDSLTSVKQSVIPTELYNWNQYGTSVEEYLTSKDYMAQAQAMEHNLSYCHEVHQKVPPGFHLHLGMLYGQLGYASRMKSEFALERALYPESRHLVDFIMSINMNGGMK